ncbi:hypothetical protein BBJ28_00006924 [Nothophytophthora sp. Chile5]|nr:hypothetical protein BBJ28_00006924 [Nothophytophthora sp. Chile5]
MGASVSVVETLDSDGSEFFKLVRRELECTLSWRTKDEYDRRVAAGDSEEQIFCSLRGLVACHLESNGSSPLAVDQTAGPTAEAAESEQIPATEVHAYTAEELPVSEAEDTDASNRLLVSTDRHARSSSLLDAATLAAVITANAAAEAKELNAETPDVSAKAVDAGGAEADTDDFSTPDLPPSKTGFGRCAGTSKNAFDLAQNLTPVFTTDVLTDPAMLKMILKYAEANKVPNGADMLRFWVEVDELQHLPSHSYTHRRLHKIYDKFLSPEAPSPVCVTAQMLQDIQHALEGDNISAGIYSEAQQICYVALERSVYPRFRDSKLFRKMQDFCAPIHPNGGPSGPSTASATGSVAADIGDCSEDAEDFSLLGILAHPTKLRFLKTFCMEALALENLLFYLEVEDCKRLPNLSFVVNKTRKIYDRYCSVTSKNFITGLGEDGALRELQEAVDSKAALVPKLFYEVQLTVFDRISHEIWQGFCRSQEYLEHSKDVKPDPKQLNRRLAPRFEQSEVMQQKLNALSEIQLIEAAMHYSVDKLIPLKYPGAGSTSPRAPLKLEDDVLTPQQQLTLLLNDSFAKKYFKLFMTRRGVDSLLAFCEEVEDFKLLPGIEFLQHSAKKIYRKYMMPSARLQVDMSAAMRNEIFVRLANPSVDMFKKIAARVRHGMLQDSLPRFVKSEYYKELRRESKHAELQLTTVDIAAKAGKLELCHLDVFLNHPGCMQAFRRFLDFQHCSENLMLWEEIEHYRRLPSYQIVLRSAKKIYDKYLNPSNARSTIPLAPALLQRVGAQLEVACRTTFDEVESECYDHMRNVVVPDFLDSRIFMALVGTWATVHDDYPAEMLRGELEMAFLRHRFHLVQEARGMSRDSPVPTPDKQHRVGVTVLGGSRTSSFGS